MCTWTSLPAVLLLGLLAGPASGWQDDDALYDELQDQAFEAIGGQHTEEAIALLERCLELRPEDDISAYNLACAHALTASPDEAITWLRRSLDWGYWDVPYMLRDTDLDSLRSNPRHRSLLLDNLAGVARAAREELARTRAQVDRTPIVWQDGHPSRILGVVFSPDGRDLLSWDDGGRTILWDVESGEPISYPGVYQGERLRAAFSADGSRLMIHDDVAWDLTLLDPRTGWRVDLGDDEHFYTGFAFGPKGERFVTIELTGEVRVWDAAQGRPLGAPLTSFDMPRRVDWSGDGRHFHAFPNSLLAART